MQFTNEAIYPVIRFSLAVMCLLVARKIRSFYFLLSGASLLAFGLLSMIIPSLESSAMYWRFVWLPVEAVRLALAIWTSVWIFNRTGRILRAERLHILGFGLFAGVSLCLAGGLWIPQNWFQAVVAIRQYVYLMLSVTVVCWWARLWVRPTMLPFLVGCWCWWLLFGTVMAAGGKGGILWAVVPWSGGSDVWYFFGNIAMAGQSLVACALLVAFHPRESFA